MADGYWRDEKPLCGFCKRHVECYRASSDAHRLHAARVVCSDCANRLDEMADLMEKLVESFGTVDVEFYQFIRPDGAQ